VPEVILLDLMMPVVNGQQFRAEQLRCQELATIPVVVMTGSVVQPTDFTAPVAGWLRKPFDVDELFDTLRAAMAGTSRPAP
jgi:CheY-like chemotaxis protein